MYKELLILVFLVFLETSFGQIIQDGQCVEVGIDSVDINALLGEWNELGRSDDANWRGDCSKIYVASENDTTTFYNELVNENFFYSYGGTVEYESGNRLTLHLTNSTESLDVWLLLTDYANYAVFYSCTNIDEFQRSINVFQLSRNTAFSELENGFITTSIQNLLNIQSNQLRDLDFSDDACYILPIIDQGESIILPGLCDLNMTPVSNFNETRFAGLWHEISYYHMDFYQGTCGRNDYTIRNEDGSTWYDIVRDQVSSQALMYLYGQALVSPGVLATEIYYPDVNGVTASYEQIILDTDYDEYAIMYSCYNQPDNYKRVYSWILSRTRQLSDEAQAAVAEVINSRIDLNVLYYHQVDQTDEGCFYYPEPEIDQTVVFRGQCDTSIPTKENFIIDDYMGIWHEIESYPSTHQTGTCNNAVYELETGTVDFSITQVFDEQLHTIHGLAQVDPNANDTAKLIATFSIPGTNTTIIADYWILETDYKSYAFAYSCLNLDDDHRAVWSWKLSRTKQMPDEGTTEIERIIANTPVLDQMYYQERNQSEVGCFYYPVPEPGKPVIFPGQCDQNLTVVTDFNLTLFEGIWHEIEAYPKLERTGQCVNHEYIYENTSRMGMVSSQIVNQFRQVSEGYTELLVTDGSAKLEINIPINGSLVTIPFWILSINYTDYALAYSCINLDSDYRAVWSWKLSRNKELSDNAMSEINETISTIDILNDVYYEPVDQSDEACFYLPQLEPGEPVILVGRCDPNITVVSNFNVTSYAGRWRTIESYPIESQIGSCIDATYILNDDGSITVSSSQVVNESLLVGSLLLQTTDGSGKLTVVSPDENTPSEYWVLDTDYESYSLVYSCENIGNDERRVWSWKLSRKRDMSTEATEAINEIMDGINVLNDYYFETYDHTDDACFYYPVPDGNPVIFRGRCGDDLPVVTDFRIEEYMGDWNEIESYPQDFQEGTCQTHEYTLNSGIVDIMKGQIIVQKLNTINGTAVPTAENEDGVVAKLEVTLSGPTANETYPYWVLATDYENYALVYSCYEIDEEHRRVSSWKLSRDKNLSESHENIINEAMSNVKVLHQQYFEARNHSTDDCFFYPNNFGGPVLQNGQCPDDDNVGAMTSFDVDGFSGIWYEVARFPSELQSGECIFNNFVVNSGNFDITQTVIVNERLVTISGTGTVSANGSAIIEAILTDDVGGSTNITLYVLDTDYEEFALLYSCRNVGNSTKQIYSWKLSKLESGLTESANNLIDETVLNHIDLDADYYEETERSFDSCFYYPVLLDNSTFIELPGVCDDRIQGMANFDFSAYLGRWFEISKYPFESAEGECSQYLYEFGEINDFTVFTSTFVNNNSLETIEGIAVPEVNDGEITIIVEENGEAISESYIVIGTDYDSYALLYKCRNLDNGNSQAYSWKLSRQRTLSDQSVSAINALVANTRGLLEDYYQDTKQTDEACFYVPELVPNENIVFRGQCENITGVENFDVQRYQGWWHEIERYPNTKNVGDCLSSRYQSSGNQYVVVETNVFGQTSQIDTSTVVADDNGKLTITRPNGEVVDMWVLATDYETYSLVYSCENIDDEYRQVWSAKYSKSRYLTEEAEDAMAPYIERNEVLYGELYMQVNQSDSACFHYPQVEGDTVILPGQCDTSIPTVQDFQTDMYTGNWYHIERYPVPDFYYESRLYQNGICPGVRYTWDEEGRYDVLNWDVVDGEVRAVEGTATINVTDGTTFMFVHLPIYDSLTIVSTQLYVLDTDYVGYSLVMNCLNINEFQRRVAVWKLSRDRSLSASANQAINQYMEGREEFFSSYFISLTQRDGCEIPNSGFLFRGSAIALLICIVVHILISV